MNVNRIGTIISCLLIGLMIGLGCAKPPLMKEVTADPIPVAAGKKITFIARFEGTADNIASVTGIARGYSDYTITLNDEGREGDQTAGDGVWTFSINMPWEAPAGTYLIDFTALDKEGNKIEVSGGDETEFTFELIVK